LLRAHVPIARDVPGLTQPVVKSQELLRRAQRPEMVIRARVFDNRESAIPRLSPARTVDVSIIRLLKPERPVETGVVNPLQERPPLVHRPTQDIGYSLEPVSFETREWAQTREDIVASADGARTQIPRLKPSDSHADGSRCGCRGAIGPRCSDRTLC